jgi:uncharacterized protein (TIGR03086 family)
MELVDVLEGQLGRNQQAIEAVPDSALGGSTPCPEFDTRALIAHMVGANQFFIAVARGESPGGSGAPAPDASVADLAAAHRSASEQLLRELRTPGVLDRTFDFSFTQLPGTQALGIMLVETTAHGWDLAKATGGDASIDPNLATMLLQGAQAVDAVRTPSGNPFGPAVEVPESAPPGDRFMAFLGRTP